jgi:hypothetical protein
VAGARFLLCDKPFHRRAVGVVGADRVMLSVPLSGTWIDIAFTLPPTVVDGGAPMVVTSDAAAAMRAVLAIAAGVDGPEALPPLIGRSSTVRVEWDPDRVADHTGVTATFGAPLAPTLSTVPDALVGRCWPAVFAAIGGATTDTDFPVVEGLLSLVHLDHAARLLKPLPREKTELTVTATSSAAYDTEFGRVVPVTVNINDASGVGDDGDLSVNRFGSGVATRRNGNVKGVALFALEGQLGDEVAENEFLLVSGESFVTPYLGDKICGDYYASVSSAEAHDKSPRIKVLTLTPRTLDLPDSALAVSLEDFIRHVFVLRRVAHFEANQISPAIDFLGTLTGTSSINCGSL